MSNISFQKQKIQAGYKTIYLKNDAIDKLYEIANKNNTSFNNVIVNMIDYCLKNQ